MIRSTLVAFAALALAGTAQAQDPHAGHGAPAAAAPAEVKTTPANGAMTHGSPPAFELKFPHAMKLDTLSLKGPAGTVTVEVPAAAPSATVTVPLPKLVSGNYVATWRATGADGHAMTGDVAFMVH